MMDVNLENALKMAVEILPDGRLSLKYILFSRIYDKKSFRTLGRELNTSYRTIHYRFQKACSFIVEFLKKEGWSEDAILKLISRRPNRLPTPPVFPKSKKYVGIIMTKNLKRFHRYGCRYLELLKFKTSLLYFSTQKEAIINGFKPCRRCLSLKQ